MKTMLTLTAAAWVAALARPATAQTMTLETAPPVVVKTVPVAGLTEVDPGLTEIRVTYSKPMQDGSWSWSTWGEGSYPETTGKPRYLADRRTCVLPVKLNPGKFYAIWLNSEKFRNFKDASGRAAVPYLLTFTTAAAVATKETTVREVALQFATAIGERNNDRLQALATDAVVKGWVAAVTHFGDELRVHLTESGVGFKPLGQIDEVLVKGDLAAVKSAHVEARKAYLVLFFFRTSEGWRNCSLQNSPASKSLAKNLQEFMAREKVADKLRAEGADIPDLSGPTDPGPVPPADE